MSETPPATPADRLAALFDTLESQQIEFLDTAGKRIIELCTTLLGVVFAVTAFGDKFPPPYLKANPLGQALLITALALLMAAIGLSLVALTPRKYPRYEYNVTAMREVLDRILNHKSTWLRAASVAFALGALALAALVVLIIRQA